MIKKILIVLIFCASFVACNCDCPCKDKKPNASKTMLFGHRGSGGGINNGLIENTLPGIIEVLKFADGTEADIQMSQSKTLWIYHDDLFNHLCPESKTLIEKGGYTCILNTPDEVIEQLYICRDGIQERFYKVEELFEVLSDYDHKMASLDIKGYFNTSCVQYNNVSEEYQQDLAKELFRLVKEYDLLENVIAETNYLKVHEALKELDSNFICHYMSYNNHAKGIEKAVASNLDGITMNIHDSSFNLANFNKAKDNQLTVQFWTINSKEDAIEALKYDPYGIQVSSLSLIKKLSTLDNQEKRSQLFQ